MARPATLGGSIPVKNVQALAATPASLTDESLLGPYIRPELAQEVILDADSGAVPTVDLSRLNAVQHSDEEASVLKLACAEWGFFQIVNHGIPEQVLERVRSSVEAFFAQPLEARNAVAQRAGDPEGYGQAFVASEEQKLEWGDMLFLFVHPPSNRSLHLWPALPDDLRSSLECYCEELMKVQRCVMQGIARSLGVEPAKLSSAFGSQTVRINYYPPCPASLVDKVTGLAPHSDAVGLTLLLHVNGVPGLQIRRPGGWLPVKPLQPNALLANVGDVLEILTNGKCKSVEHRAMVNADRERMSIAAFHTREFGTMIGPLLEVVGQDRALYRSISTEEFRRMNFSRKLDGENKLVDQMKI